MISETQIKRLKSYANRVCWVDDTTDFNPASASGGNYDDAYYGGQDDGYALCAREVLDDLGIKYKS